jgi:hypothetical protein
MRISRLAGTLAVVLLAGHQPALAQDASASHRESVKRLMAVTHVRELTEQSLEMILKQQLEQMPQLAPYASVLRDFYREQLSWGVLEPDLTRIYLEVFTEPEITEMVAFYETPLGQKMLAKMPQLMAKSNEVTSRRMQAAMPQLMQRLEAAMREKASSPADTGRTHKP